jgi:hypothetical protein
VLEGVDGASKKRIAELLAVAATKQAMKGNSPYFKEIIERIEGKVTNRIELTGKYGGPVEWRITYED